MSDDKSADQDYQKGSLSLPGAVAMGTGVMIGAGIFALTGQIAELAGGWFPVIFLAAAGVAGTTAYSYVKLSNDDPSAGGIAMYLGKAYGKGVVTAGMALLMYFSMVINEALVARTFGEYVVQLFAGPDSDANATPGGKWAVPVLAMGLLVVAYVVNVAANKFIDRFQLAMATVKIVGILVFAGAGLWVGGLAWSSFTGGAGTGDGAREPAGVVGLVAATALGLLAYKGFTTITNDGGELVEPKKNVGRAIVIALAICTVVYTLVALAVGGSLSVPEIVEARDYALAEAARPVFGRLGLWFTVGLAVVACVSGVIASVFAVSRMLAMLVEMKLVPFRRVGIPGRLQYTTLTYTIVFAAVLALLFDLSRIAALGALFYLVMDFAIHWGVLTRLRKQLGASAAVVVVALVCDVALFAGLTASKFGSDPLVLLFAVIGFAVIFGGEWLYLRKAGPAE